MSAQVSTASDSQVTKDRHFDPKGKMPSPFTVELQNGLRKPLPFQDERDFEESKKGFIAAPPYKQIMVNLFTPDNGEKFVVEMGNFTLTNCRSTLRVLLSIGMAVQRF